MRNAIAKPDDALLLLLIADIEEGAYAEDAAASLGVSLATWRRWLEQGRRKTAMPIYRRLVKAVDAAEAKARVKASQQVFRKAPLSWLTKGPGKERGERPGWTAEVKPVLITQDNRSVNLLAHPETGHMLTHLLAVLERFPEARKAAVEALNNDSAPSSLTG